MSLKKEKLLRLNVAADRIGVTDRQVRRLVADKKLPVVEESPRRRFIPESAVETYRHLDEQ